MGRACRALTLVELLVVIVIIAILVSAVVAASGAMITRARITNTQAMLTVVREAVDQFKREQEANPTITRVVQPAATEPVRYQDRYGLFPPDELEVFTPLGLPGSDAGPTLGPRGATIVPSPPPKYGPMWFYVRGREPKDWVKEHRDLMAMVLAIEIYGDASAAILDRIQERYRSPGPVDPKSNKPILFLDMPDATGNLNSMWDSGDYQIRYIVDDWGVPIAYMAQRNWDPRDPPEPSTNHPLWSEVSTELVRLNGGRPVIMSYGPDGTEQLTEERMGPGTATASLVGDFEEPDDGRHKINHVLNADNVYADPTLKEKLASGI